MKSTLIVFLLLWGCLFSVKGQSVDSSGLADMFRTAYRLIDSDADSAYTIFRHCDSLATATADSVMLMKILDFYGTYYSKKSEFKQSAYYYLESLRMAEKYRDSLQIGIVKNNMGVLYFGLNKLQAAQENYQTAYDMFIALDNKKWLAKVTGNYAGVYFMNKNYEEAVTLLKTSISNAIQAKEFIAVVSAYSNLAIILNALGRKDEALELFEVGLQQLDSIGDKKGTATVLLQMGKLQEQLGAVKSAKASYYLAIDLATAIDYKVGLMHNYKQLYKLYLKEDKDSAIYCLNQYVNWKDSVLTAKEILIVNEMENKYNNLKKQRQIEALQATQERDKALNRSQQLEIRNLWIIALAAILLIVLIAFQLRTKQKNNKILLEKNIIIQQALQDKEVLMREIHHRVKNNFQLVSSVLMIQASKVNDSIAKSILMDTRNRIQSMSSMHLRLYQSEASVLHKVMLKDFLEDLLDELKDAHAEESFELQTQIAAIHITMDKAIAVGLIVTEAVLNAFKHAFETGAQRIEVALSQDTEGLNLTVQDNGKGFQDLGNDNFGLRMIKNLVQKSNGTLQLDNNKGACVQVKLPL